MPFDVHFKHGSLREYALDFAALIVIFAVFFLLWCATGR
jgi:hypothetical protein